MENQDPDWGYLQQITKSEHHFNDLVFRIRALSSTWLLASFAGIGFVMTKDLDVGIPQPILVLGISILGGFGLFLLWMLDILVYQTLLAANFDIGIEIEKRNPALPQVRHRMIREMLKGNARYRTVWFHIAMVDGALIPGYGLLFAWLIREQPPVAMGTLVLFVGAIALASWFMYSQSGPQR